MERTLGSASMFKPHTTDATGMLPLRGLATVLLWQRRISSRRALARLDERLLADAGISLHERAEEISKPFWR